MASRHTEHYGLSQWEASDKVERTDFNADNAAVDGALHALAQSKAETAALSQLSGLVAQKPDPGRRPGAHRLLCQCHLVGKSGLLVHLKGQPLHPDEF